MKQVINFQLKKGLCVLSETCACPKGMVDHEGECIQPSECQSCLEKYPEGATWKDDVDPCVEYICENSSVRSIEYRCDSKMPTCGQYEKLVSNTTEECCTRYECECDQEKCPAAPTCAEGEYLIILATVPFRLNPRFPIKKRIL